MEASARLLESRSFVLNWSALRIACALLYMAITGVVFAVLLAGLQESLNTTSPGWTSSSTS